MKWAQIVWREIFGLFVDNGRFALFIAVWLTLAGLALPVTGLPAGVAGLILFAGLAIILLDSVTRRARA